MPRPHRPGGDNLVHVEQVGRPDSDRPGDRLDAEHVPRPAVRRRAVDPQTAALPDREAIAALVTAHDLAVVIHDRPRRRAEPALEEAPGVTVGDETDVVAVRLVGHRETAPRRFRADLLLGAVTEREHRPAQLAGGQHAEYVGLILGLIDAARQPKTLAREPGAGPLSQRTDPVSLGVGPGSQGVATSEGVASRAI